MRFGHKRLCMEVGVHIRKRNEHCDLTYKLIVHLITIIF